MRWIGAVAFGGVMGRNAPNGSAKESRPAQPIHQFQLNKNKNNERSVVGRQSIDGINLLMKSIDEAKTTTQVEHQAAPLRGKPFSNSHFFFFVKKRNGIAEMEKGLKDIITVFLV